MKIASRLWVGSLSLALLGGALAGCAGHGGIPKDAHEETVGTGHLSYTANQPGNVYVLDQDKSEKVFEGKVNQGDQIVLEPDQDRIVLAGNMVDHKPALNPSHRYGIYFTPGS